MTSIPSSSLSTSALMRLGASLALLAALVPLACRQAHPRAAAERTEVPTWRSLFDGRTLEGWTTRGGRYDGDARWTVEDGAITGRQGANGEGGLLYTEELFDEFDFACEFRIEEPMDSGVFLRMVPDERGVQLTIDHHGDGELGGIYSDGWLAHNPDGWKHFVRAGWNRLEIASRGPDEHATIELEATLNGQPLVSYTLPANAVGFARAGRIGLQVHGGQGMAPETQVQFKEIRVRPVARGNAGHAGPTPDGEPPHDATSARDTALASEIFVEHAGGSLALSAHGWREGWRPLFDGASLAGWQVEGAPEGISVEEGAIVIRAGHGGELRTLGDHRDFDLVLDFQTSALANSGVFLRAARDGKNPAFSGCEVQILDDFHWEEATKSTLQPWQFTGSLYGAVAPATREALRPNGEWNRLRILYVGPHLRVELNGVLLYDVDTHELAVEPPFATRAPTGFLGLQRHGAAKESEPSWVRFRNLFVRRIDGEDPSADTDG